MQFNQLHQHCCYWLSFALVALSCYTSSECKVSAQAISARKLLENWRRKAEEQARLFDRLPQHPELFYTPV